MQYQTDEFLSAVFGRSVWSIKDVQSGSGETIAHWLTAVQPQFVSTKTNVLDTSVAHELRAVGFVPVDEMVTLEKQRTRGAVVSLVPGYSLRWAARTDEKDIVAIARIAFRCSRWHNDPSFSHEEADNVKAAWAANYFRGQRGDGMVVVATETAVVGFLQVLIQNEVLILDLMAIDHNHRGRGLGKAVVRWTEENWQGPDVTTLRVGTQARNAPALALYAACGFAETGREHVWHWHAAVPQSKVTT